jgi:hypothetical protein
VSLSVAEWDVLVSAVKQGHLGPSGESAPDCGCGCDCGCCASVS